MPLEAESVIRINSIFFPLQVLLAWTLSNVCPLSSQPRFVFTHSLRNIGSVSCSRSVRSSPHISGGATTHSYFRSFTGDATHKTAEKTVNGYLTFLLFSVAGLACKSYVPSFCFLMINLSHFSVVRFVGSTTYMIVRLFAGE